MEEKTLATTGSGAIAFVPTVAKLQTMLDNTGGNIAIGDLDRIKFPAGESIAFAVPTLDGETYLKEIRGVIVFRSNQNAFWKVSKDEATESNSPPDCVARDGANGVGDPGGVCAKCPYNAFESAKKGKGKACKNTVLLFLLPKGSILPYMVSIPPTSLATLRKYFVRLGNAGISYYEVETRISLERKKSALGQDYAHLVISSVQNSPNAESEAAKSLLPSDAIAQVEAYRENILPYLQQVAVQVTPPEEVAEEVEE